MAGLMLVMCEVSSDVLSRPLGRFLATPEAASGAQHKRDIPAGLRLLRAPVQQAEQHKPSRRFEQEKENWAKRAGILQKEVQHLEQGLVASIAK